MKAAEFAKTTLIGGLLFILPLYICLLLLEGCSGITCPHEPIAAQIPASVQFREILAIFLIAAFCFIAGLIVRTGPRSLCEKCI